jgi:hypothetical protein
MNDVDIWQIVSIVSFLAVFVGSFVIVACVMAKGFRAADAWLKAPKTIPPTREPMDPEMKSALISAGVTVGFWSIVFSIVSFPIAIILLFLSGNNCSCGHCHKCC